MPCFLLSIWSVTEWEGVTENTSGPVKAASEQATFGNLCLAMISHLAPVLLKPVKAVPTRQPAVCLYHCIYQQRPPDLVILHTDKQHWRHRAGTGSTVSMNRWEKSVAGREQELPRTLVSIETPARLWFKRLVWCSREMKLWATAMNRSVTFLSSPCVSAVSFPAGEECSAWGELTGTRTSRKLTQLQNWGRLSVASAAWINSYATMSPYGGRKGVRGGMLISSSSVWAFRCI